MGNLLTDGAFLPEGLGQTAVGFVFWSNVAMCEIGAFTPDRPLIRVGVALPNRVGDHIEAVSAFLVKHQTLSTIRQLDCCWAVTGIMPLNTLLGGSVIE